MRDAGPHRRTVYTIARRACDEIEAIAPWHDLYAPPHDPVASARLAATVHSWAASLRTRIDDGLAALEAVGCDPVFVEYGGYYLGAVATMLRADTLRLASAIEAARRPGAGEAEANIACEIAADVKGKGTSSLMGAAASLVAEGRWDPVATEPLLFPEKNQEFRRNYELLAAVLEISATLHRIRSTELLTLLGEAWSGTSIPDRWAVADLGMLVAQVSQLLHSDRRRALYAGDFHQLERRLRLVSARVGELDRLHTELVDGTAESPVRRRLVTLIREVAALVEAGALNRMLPEGELPRLRSLLELSAQLDGHLDVASAARRGALEPTATALLALLADDDLTTYVGLLAANVARRVSFQLEIGHPSHASKTALDAEVPRLLAPASGAEANGDCVVALRRVLDRLRSDSYPGARQFRMVLKLLESHNRVPEALLAGCRPYIHDLVDEVVPVLEPVITAGLLPSSTRHELVADALALATGSARGPEATSAMQRLARLLESLRAPGTSH